MAGALLRRELAKRAHKRSFHGHALPSLHHHALGQGQGQSQSQSPDPGQSQIQSQSLGLGLVQSSSAGFPSFFDAGSARMWPRASLAHGGSFGSTRGFSQGQSQSQGQGQHKGQIQSTYPGQNQLQNQPQSQLRSQILGIGLGQSSSAGFSSLFAVGSVRTWPRASLACGASFGSIGGFSQGQLLGLGLGKVPLAGFSSSASGGEVEGGGDLGSQAGELIRDSIAGSLETARATSEVAAVVGDCFFPIAWIQLLVESIHIHAGLPWWASIAATTVAIRTLMIPVTLYQMRMTARLTIMRPQSEKLMDEMKNSGYDMEVMNRARVQVKELYRKNKVSPLSPMVGVLIQAPLFAFFFFGIRNMVEHVASFKEGGALWFTDLTTPDELYILPGLTSLTFLLTVELGMADGMEGNPHASKMKIGFRIFSLVLIPLTMTFQKALFCYWLTSNVFSLCQGAVLRIPGVKAAAGIPDTSHLSENVSQTKKPIATFVKPPNKVNETELRGNKVNDVPRGANLSRRKNSKKRSGKGL